MLNRVISLFIFLFSVALFSQQKYLTIFENGNGNQTASYSEVIDFYKLLDVDFQTINMQTKGLTDSGYPLHMVVYNQEKEFNFEKLNKTKSVVLINNAIHPGEPDGVDATMMLFRDLALGKIKIPKNVVLVTIPVYNIGGMLNRNSTSRTNQNGPEEYGFRGNGRNFDLNRDLIKVDTKNSKALIDVFHTVKPDVFIDNHVSNGADYQYTLTYIQTNPNRLGKELGNYISKKMSPNLVGDLKKKGIEAMHYVDSKGETPDSGLVQFLDSPRYTTGYTSLFNCLGYVVETHMWKPYTQRVKATYEFMESVMRFVEVNKDEIKKFKKSALEEFQIGNQYPVKWELDTTKVEKINFLGYESGHKQSDVTTGNRLFYDRSKPYEKEIKFYSSYKPIAEISIPKAYIIPQSWWNVLDLLKENHCQFSRLKKDSLITVESYKITDYKTASSPYEGHYPHRNVKVVKSTEKVAFRKGDYVFSTNQEAVKFLIEVLEPEATDSYFNWNFFDTILQQKEWYSDYLFEDLANQLLKENPQLQREFDEKRKEDLKFASNPAAQLEWVHKHSRYYEKAHLLYPVFRIMK
jgi:hypothetical protein